MDQPVPVRQSGRQLLLNFLEESAGITPDKNVIHQVTVNGSELRDNPISYKTIVSKINQMAWWLEKYLPRNDNISCIAYIGPSDVRNILLSLAVAKLESKLLLLSPRNSTPIHTHLLNSSKCDIIIYDKSFEKAAKAIVGCVHIPAPDISEVLSDHYGTEKSYPYQGTWETACLQGFVVLQTTGSTGMPKPVTICHGAIGAIYAQNSLRGHDGVKCQLQLMAEAQKLFVAFPLFHVAGFGLSCFLLLAGCTLVFGPPHRPVSPEIVRGVLRAVNLDAGLIPPAVLDDIHSDPSFLEDVSQLNPLVYGGGQVRQATGDILSKKTQLLNGMGSTECGSVAQYPVDPQHWSYFHFCEHNGIKWRPTSGSQDEYEMVFCRNDSFESYQGVFRNFPSLVEWPTKDIYRKHPSKKDYWEYRGRLDDVIVLTTGEKLNPISIESSLAAKHPEVRAALVIGTRRSHPALLVELKAPGVNEQRKTKLIHEIAVIAGEENQQNSRDAQLLQQDILLTKVDKPFCRTGKGTVHRADTLRLYADEIDELYSSTRDHDVGFYWNLNFSSPETLALSIAVAVGQLIQQNSLGIDDDFFQSGLDSRQAQIAATLFKKALPDGRTMKNEHNTLSVRTIYRYPTARRLAEFLYQIERAGPLNADDHFEAVLKRYIDLLPPPNQTPKVTCQSPARILLTGSTGFVGSHILEALCRRAEIQQIICFDRPRPEQSTNNLTRTAAEDDSKVRRISGDLSQNGFKIQAPVYSDLLETVTCIVHCQWPVNFNQDLNDFEESIRGVRNLVQFCHEAKSPVPIVFLSSVAAVRGWDDIIPVPEKHLESPSLAQYGYGQSKLIASLLLQKAAESSRIRSTICRLGQVGGPVSGGPASPSRAVWPLRDWFPTLLLSSQKMGALPNSLGNANVLDWIPVDVLADAMGDLVVEEIDESSKQESPSSTNYYHLTNPRHIQYEDVLGTISRRFGDSCKVIPLPDWVELLEKHALESGTQTESRDVIPGTQLLSFFRDLLDVWGKGPVILDTTVTTGRTPHLQKLEPVNEKWITMWLDQWGF